MSSEADSLGSTHPPSDFPGIAPPPHVTVVAEAGTAHQGDITVARRLIDAAKKAGADIVKFQAVLAKEIVHPNVGSIDLPGGEIDIYERFRGLERPVSFYRELKKATEESGLQFLCSPFGRKTAEILLSLGVKWVKIASPELNHYPLLEQASRAPLILSTGVSTLADIEEALTFLRSEVDISPPAALLHCITSYPAPEEEYNLRILPLYSRLFGVPVGLSDHSLHPFLVPALSVPLGARIIEKHLTLSHEGTGLDDPIALNPHEFEKMVEWIRYCEGKSLEEIKEALRAVQVNGKRIEAVLGSGEKKLALSETAFYRGTNRSLVAFEEIERGERLDRDNCTLLRSEQGNSPGLAPRHFEKVLGAKASRRIEAGEGITWSHLLEWDGIA